MNCGSNYLEQYMNDSYKENFNVDSKKYNHIQIK